MSKRDRRASLLGWIVRLKDYFWANELGREMGELDVDARVAWAFGMERAEQLLETAKISCDARLFAPALRDYRRSALELIACAHFEENGDPQAETAEPEMIRLFLETKRSEWRDPTTIEVLKSDEASLWSLPRSELARRCEVLDRDLARWFCELPRRSPAQVRGARILRISSAVLMLFVLLVAQRAWQYFPKDLSHGRPVMVSSVEPGKNPAGIVDDIYTGHPPFISKKEAQPWVVIDLGRVQMVTYAKVVGRHDCCFAESVPLVFEVSRDGKEFDIIDERTTPFVPLEPWIVSDIMRRARYVRLRSKRKTQLALTEVTVYGRQK